MALSVMTNSTRRQYRVGLLLVWVALITAVVASALAVVYAKYQCRVLFTELQVLRQERDKMEIEWGQLQLELSAWAARGDMGSIARNRLGMVLPTPQQVVVIRP